MGEIIPIPNRDSAVATCPECDSQTWIILVDKLGKWDHFLGFECAECDFKLILQMVPTVLSGDELEEFLSSKQDEHIKPSLEESAKFIKKLKEKEDAVRLYKSDE